jgi:hypothetical protein
VALLSPEGPRSKRAFALFCAERVAHLITDPRVVECLAVIRQKVTNPESVTKRKLTRIRRVVSTYTAYSDSAAPPPDFYVATAVTIAASASLNTDAAVYAAHTSAYARTSSSALNLGVPLYAAERSLQEAWLVFTNGFVSFPS